MGGKAFGGADCIITSAGIDWLTLTSTNQDTKEEMQQCFRRASVAASQLGYETKPGGAWGFYGLRAEHALYGEKADRSMLVVSNEAAKQCVVLARKGDNATRLDVQITLRVGEQNVSKFLEHQFRCAAAGGERRGSPKPPKAVVTPDAYQTVYVGSRKSDIFIRCYDKFVESGDEAYRGCVRLEAEYKGKASQALWTHLAENNVGVMFLLQFLLQTLAAKGLDVDMVDLDRQDHIALKRQRHRDEVTVGWLGTQVAKAVQRVSRTRGWWVAFTAVFNECCNEEDKGAILHSLALQWGD